MCGICDNTHGRPPNLPSVNILELHRGTPSAPDLVWRSDITAIAIDEVWLHMAAATDLVSRQVVGWSRRPRLEP